MWSQERKESWSPALFVRHREWHGRHPISSEDLKVRLIGRGIQNAARTKRDEEHWVQSSFFLLGLPGMLFAGDDSAGSDHHVATFREDATVNV